MTAGDELEGERLPPPDRWARPPGVSDETVAALGRFSEALEWVERARGRIYDFHQMLGRADALLGDAVTQLRDAGHGELADRVEAELVGRNVLEGRWTFQVVEEFDATYWTPFRRLEQQARDDLAGGVPHLFEAEMKQARRTKARRHHESRPPAAD